MTDSDSVNQIVSTRAVHAHIQYLQYVHIQYVQMEHIRMYLVIPTSVLNNSQT